MKKLRFAAFAAGLLSLATLCFSLPASAEQPYKDEYKLSTVLSAVFPWGWGAMRWTDLVAEKTEGRINIRVYPNASLVSGDQSKEFDALRQGDIDMAIGSTINWSPQVTELNLFSLPFLMPDHKAIDALTHGRVGRQMFEILAKYDVAPLAWGANGFREVSNSKRPIHSPEDIKGMKMRIVGSPLFFDTFNALGAEPILMRWTEVQSAIAAGTIDGQENPLSVFNAAKLHSVNQKHITLWNYVADPLIFVVNKSVWNSWSEADQKAVAEAAQQAAIEEIVRARAGISEGDDAVLKEIEANGVAIVRLSDAERDVFKAATAGVYKDWAEKIGVELVKQAEEDIAKR